MISSQNGIEDEAASKDDMPIITPQVDIILQSDCNGLQQIPKSSRLSWFSAVCNCFRAMDLQGAEGDMAMLGEQLPHHVGRNTLVLDLDETLVHSSFLPISADINMDIQIDRQNFKVYVLKRPGVDLFLKRCSEMFEVVVFTASLSAYANPLLDVLDKDRGVAWRLFRKNCSFVKSTYVKDLARLGRSLKHTIIVDVWVI